MDIIKFDKDTIDALAKLAVEGTAELLKDPEKRAAYVERLSIAVITAMRTPGCEVRVTVPTPKLLCASIRLAYEALRRVDAADAARTAFPQLELTNGSCILFLIGETE